MNRWRSSLAASLGALMLVACDALLVPAIPATPDPLPPEGGVPCRLRGCESELNLDLAGELHRGMTYEIRACLDDICASESIDVPASGIGLSGPLRLDADRNRITYTLPDGEFSGARQLSLSLDGSDGISVRLETEIRLERVQPNGPRCRPVCWQATIAV